jgi:hypothetical protein
MSFEMQDILAQHEESVPSHPMQTREHSSNRNPYAVHVRTGCIPGTEPEDYQDFDPVVPDR